MNSSSSRGEVDELRIQRKMMEKMLVTLCLVARNTRGNQMISLDLRCPFSDQKSIGNDIQRKDNDTFTINQIFYTRM